MIVQHSAQAAEVNQGKGVTRRREPLHWIAEESFRSSPGGEVALVAMPDTFSLQRFIIKTLHSNRVPYALAHSASGIAVLIWHCPLGSVLLV